MQLFSADPIVFSKKKIKKKFDPENMTKLPSKVAHNRPPTFFFNTGPAAQTAQKQKFRTPKSPLMQDCNTHRAHFHKSPLSASNHSKLFTSKLSQLGFLKNGPPAKCSVVSSADYLEQNRFRKLRCLLLQIVI